jgi:hypothetical protein
LNQTASVRIPAALRWVHGEQSTAFQVALVYGAAVVFGVLAAAVAARLQALPAWKAVILFVLAADASGGAVAGFTESTSAWYARRPAFKRAFIIAHVIQPAVLYLLFDARLGNWLLLYVFTAGAALLVDVIPGRERQEPLAAALAVLGIVIVLPLGLSAPSLAWFAPVYMVELIMGFGVTRAR